MLSIGAVHKLDQSNSEPMPFKFSISKRSFPDLKTSITLDYPDMTHLSLPENFDPGIIQEEGHSNRDQKLQERQLSNTSCPKKKIILQLVEAIKVSLELSHSVKHIYNSPGLCLEC